MESIMSGKLIKQVISNGSYSNPTLQFLSNLDSFFIDSKGQCYDQNREPLQFCAEPVFMPKLGK